MFSKLRPVKATSVLLVRHRGIRHRPALHVTIIKIPKFALILEARAVVMMRSGLAIHQMRKTAQMAPSLRYFVMLI